ncbi:hypothetical protein BDW02DRAFT_639987 [Decorospora gaudefroyi]|uniref:F-box domain-containing protein n=1 Tax=Decorospora gaudefroyi TaxID=184978 RepID=A0A6A5K860_9PLEO|nr:hypothetical protein BDW02DRAFT_639987 [Decorospora gaudefroyi]
MSETTPSTNGLHTLPDELILEILHHIDPDDVRTISALNATSPRLRRLTVDQQFLRTIALPPPDGNLGLADRVRKVVWQSYYWTKQARRQCLSLRDRRRVADQLRGSRCLVNTMDPSMDLPGRFVHFSAESEVHWWYLEFFLFFTPKIESLLVHDMWHWDDHSYWLNSITLYGPLRFVNIVPLFILPSVRNLELTQVFHRGQEPGSMLSRTDGGEDYVEQLLAGGSTLERLVLRESDLDFQVAMDVLQKLDNIKQITYEHGDLALGEFLELPTHACSSLRDMQYGRNPTLEHLRLCIECTVEPYGILSIFSHKHPWLNDDVESRNQKLRILDIGPCNLATFIGSGINQLKPRQLVEAFPRTLETLHIQWNYDPDDHAQLLAFLDFLQSLARGAYQLGSNLKFVAIVDWPALAGWFPFQDEAIRLKRTFQDVGMQFSIVYEDIWNDGVLDLIEHEEPGDTWLFKF